MIQARVFISLLQLFIVDIRQGLSIRLVHEQVGKPEFRNARPTARQHARSLILTIHHFGYLGVSHPDR